MLTPSLVWVHDSFRYSILGLGLGRPIVPSRRSHSRSGVGNEPLKNSLNVTLLQVLVACARKDFDRHPARECSRSRTDGEVHAPRDLLSGQRGKGFLKG